MRTYPAGDVAANLIGYLSDDPEQYSGGLERSFNKLLAGKDGSETYEVGGGNRIPLGENSQVKPVNGKDLELTIDRDVAWYSQRVLRDAVEQAKAESGAAVVLDSRTGEILALADYPTFDANKAGKADKADRGSRALSDVYEPGSVEKVLTAASLLDAGKVTPRTRFTVPSELPVLDRKIGDWFNHDTIHLTMAGVIARSSNIGTAMAAQQLDHRAAVDLPRQVRAGQADRHRHARGDPRPAPRQGRVVHADARAGRVRPGPVGQRATDGDRDQHRRQRRRAGHAQPRQGTGHHIRRQRRRHRHHRATPRGQQRGRASDRRR